MTRLLLKLDSVFFLKKETVNEAYETYHAFGILCNLSIFRVK